ncbi:MAG: glycoside hydrolase family 127 protein [Spirochaetales bacterium]|nr:glycoside hydrolase family 127 protein [Spirochaetales bacterium]
MAENSKKIKIVDLKRVKVTGGLLGEKYDTVLRSVIPYQWKALNDELDDSEPSHAIENFKIAAGLSTGEFHGMVFQDSDVAKWLEAVAYQLAVNSNKELKKRADEVIDIIAMAQQEDGYLNTYYSVKEPGNRWTNLRECHELYCAGHMLEAAVAYYHATSERKLLDVMIRFIDLIDSLFGPDEGKKKGYPGHQEIELALMRLYDVTGEPRHMNLAAYFINERGQKPNYFLEEWEKRGRTNHWSPFATWQDDYNQAHLPVREQDKAIGHAVRAVYMYTAMADLARETGDESLKKACRTLWENVTNRQMYITGGIGSSGYQEAFTFDFDMPNDTAYNETCASIGLVFWALRMFLMDGESQYADVIEQALYNGVLSGMSEDGNRFFYVNPLEVKPESCNRRHDKEHVMPVRQKWFKCACCPPNLARLMTSIGQYVYFQDEGGVGINLYAGSRYQYEAQGNPIQLEQKTNYPWEGTVSIAVGGASGQKFSLKLRKPGWCDSWKVMINEQEEQACLVKDYLTIDRSWIDGDRVELVMDMPVKTMYSLTELQENAGKAAVVRGPVVYCLEEADNGSNLSSLILKDDAHFHVEYDGSLLKGVSRITAKGVRETVAGESLYSDQAPRTEATDLKFIPYYAWNNRQDGEMLVWVRV